MHPILHVVVVGFHHSKGCTIEYSYPPLQSPSDDIEANLPSLAMPDGSHNTANGDTVYFLLPALEDNRAVFGVACYRQIATDSLLSKDEGVTRSYVQKSVCVLSKIPLYGVLTAKLELITQAYFNEKDFSKVEVLQKMYESLCEIFDYSSLESSSLYMGIPLSSLFNAFGHRTLELFKIVLLERRVVFEIHPTSLLGDIIIGLVSLFPCLLEDGLFEAAAYKSGNTTQPITQNEYGFPLSIFTKGNLLHPYLSLNGIDSLRSNSIRAYCIGVTNSIFRQNSDLYDVYITIDKNGTGQILYNDSDLEKQAALTNHDFRFMQTILKASNTAKQNPAEFSGNDDWLRLQFYAYLCSLFRAAQEKDEHLPEYNEDFVRGWSVTHNYRIWSRGSHEKLAEFQSQHPSSGPMTPHDLLFMVGRRFNNFGQNPKKLMSTIATTGSQLKSTLSSWLTRSGSQQKLDK